MKANYEELMARAIELAEKGRYRTLPNPMVGAVITKDGRVVSEGYHEAFGSDHAEVMAIKNAVESLESCEMVVTLEPCTHWGKTPPCVEAIKEAGIAKVVIGTLDPNPVVSGKGAEFLKEAGIQTDIGFLEQEIIGQNEAYWQWRTTKKPFVILKAAMSLDGKIGIQPGRRTVITSEESRRLVRKLRAQCGVVMVGIGTVLADDPLLSSDDRQVLRVIADTNLRVPLDSQIVDTAKDIPTMVATNESADSAKVKALEKQGVEVKTFPVIENKIDLRALFQFLGESQAAVLVEGGTALNTSLIREGLADKYLFFYAPVIFASETAPPFAAMPADNDFIKSTNIQITSAKQIGPDILVEAYPTPA